MTTYAQIKQEGKIEGKIEGKVETEKFFVENLHKMGIPVSQIISLVKTLSKDEVMQIIESLRK